MIRTRIAQAAAVAALALAGIGLSASPSPATTGAASEPGATVVSHSLGWGA